jgi:hypothetical protein
MGEHKKLSHNTNRSKMYKVPNNNDLLWFAGFFDGEGCVTLHRKLRKNKVPCYELMLQVAGTHFPTVLGLQQIWGFGRVNQHLEKRGNRKPYWHWIVYGSKALFVLECIYEYMITKKADAYIGISFQKWKTHEADIYGKHYRPEKSYNIEQELKDILSNSHINHLSYNDVESDVNKLINIEQSVL